MTRIDAQTAIVLSGVMGGLMSLILYSLKRNYPASIKGLAQWAGAFLLLFLAGVLIGARGIVPDAVTIAASNLLLWSGVYLCYAGTQLFYGVAPRIWPWMVLITVGLMSSIWYSLVQPDYVARLAFFTALMSLLFAVHAWLIFRQGRFTFATAMTGFVLTSMASIQFLRLITLQTHPPQSGIVDRKSVV